jgi:PAS domain S-box-containing protein
MITVKTSILDINQDLLARVQENTYNLEALAHETKNTATEIVQYLRTEIEAVRLQFLELASVVQDGLVVIDEDKRITDYSPAAARIFGISKPDVIGKNLSVVMPRKYYKIFLHILESNSEEEMISVINGKGMHLNGNEIDIEFTVSRLTLSDKKYDFIVVRDVTERVRNLKEIELKNSILAAIAKCSSKWFHSVEKETIAAGLKELVDAIEVDQISIYKIGEQLELKNGWPMETKEIDIQPLRSLLSGEVFHMSIENKLDKKYLSSIGHRSLTLIPIEANGLLWGYFVLHFIKRTKKWTQPGLDTFSIIAGIYGSVLERKGKDKEIRMLQETINNFSDSVLLFNLKGQIIFANTNLISNLNVDYNDVVGKKILDPFMHDRLFWEKLRVGLPWYGMVYLNLKEKLINFDSIIVPMMNGDRDKPSYFMVIEKQLGPSSDEGPAVLAVS